MAVRFSTVGGFSLIIRNIDIWNFSMYWIGGESGSADTLRDPRGFATKFYTEDGIWDLGSHIYHI